MATATVSIMMMIVLYIIARRRLVPCGWLRDGRIVRGVERGEDE